MTISLHPIRPPDFSLSMPYPLDLHETLLHLDEKIEQVTTADQQSTRGNGSHTG